MPKDTLSSPIYLNLSGDYVIPLDGERPVAGSVSGDLRLATLDAFLMSLNSALSKKADVKEGTLTEAIKALLDKVVGDAGTKLKHSGATLSITSKINPETKEMTFNFNLSLDGERH